MKQKQRNIIKKLLISGVVSTLTILCILPANAQIIFETEYLIENSGNAFILDSQDDVSGDLVLQFGNTLGETITFDTSNSWFELSDDLNLNQNQLKNPVIDNLAAAPGTPTTGQIYYNTTSNKMFIWNGSAWQDVIAEAHAASHTDGTDDIQDATNSQKGLMTIAQVQSLESLGTQSDEINRNTINVQLTLGENVTSSVSYLTYDNPNGTDFIANIENVEFTINDSPSTGIALTGGTDASPILNYVYVKEDTGSAYVEASTTDPSGQSFDYVPIGEVLVGTVGVSSATYYYIENLTNYIRNFIGDTNQRLRVTGVIYLNGIDLSNTGLEIATTAGTIIHMHEEITYTAKDTTVDNMIDAFYNSYGALDNTNYDDGSGGNTAIGNNKYFKLFIWGDIYGGLHMERQLKPPTSEYTSTEAAEEDTENVAINSVPSQWSTVGFPIAHLIMQEGTADVLKFIDLRTMGGGGGGASAGGHSQNTDTGTTNNTFTLDADDTGGNVILEFGTTLAETFSWDDAGSQFDLSDDLDVTGNITLTGTVDGIDVAAIGAQAHNQNTDTGTTGTTFTLDSDNAGAGANVDLIAEQGTDTNGTLRYNATTNRWEINNNGGGFNDIHMANVFYGYDNAGGQTIDGTEVTLNIDTEILSDSNYTLAADEVTINETGLYRITASIGTDDINTTGGARSTTELTIQDNAVDIPGAVCRCYHRETTENACQVTVIRALDATDVVRLRTIRVNGTTNYQTLAPLSSLLIERIR